MMRSLFVLLVLCAAAARAQAPLTTLFASNNQGAPGGMVYFDLDVLATGCRDGRQQDNRGEYEDRTAHG